MKGDFRISQGSDRIRALLPDVGWREAGLESAVWLPLMFSPFLARLYIGETIRLRELLVSIAMTAFLLMMSFALPVFRAAFFAASYLILAFGGIISIGTTLSVGGSVHAYTLLSILNSDPQEVREFLSGFYPSVEYLFLLPLALPPIALVLGWRWFCRPKPSKVFIIAMAAVFVAPGVVKNANNLLLRGGEPLLLSDTPLFEYYPYHHFLPFQPYITLADAVAERVELSRLGTVSTLPVTYGGSEPATYVIVIGESLSRYHMGIYGNERDTTPRLSANKNELFVFKDVIAAHVHTEPALTAGLTFRNHETPRPVVADTLIDLFNTAGFTTFWISNQPRYGMWELAVSRLVHSADRQIWLNRNAGGYLANDLLSLDEIVLPAVAESLADPVAKKVIFVHLMGNHLFYGRRFPEKFRMFSAPIVGQSDDQWPTINDYHNSIVYNDYIVSEIIRQVRKVAGEDFVLYMSDHGDDVYDLRSFAGHNADNPSIYMTDIPFMLWLSDGYRKRQPDLAESLRRYTDRQWQVDDLLYAVADIAHLEFDGMNYAKSIFSPAFQSEDRFVGEIPYEKIVKASPKDPVALGAGRPNEVR